MSESAVGLEAVLARMASTAERCGRTAEEITLVAVSKTHPPEKIREVFDAGQTLFGESRVQEAAAKIPLLPSRAKWHFIGHLQKNKIRAALPMFELFHGVDSLALARDINRIADEIGLHPRALIEVNVAGEASKFGFSPETLKQQCDELLQLPRIQFEGLMCIPPPGPEPEASRDYFVKLRNLREELASDFGAALPHLSMGMSGDYEIAIEEGATLVRVGTAIFGPRGKTFRPAAAD